jgi:formylglycine-generating enzyme required for sulfatase activity
MVVIPAGRFVMGDSLYGHPQHLVRIRRPFAVARDMITLDEFAEFVAESGYSEDTAWQVAGSSRKGRDPVVSVNWDDAQAYVKWLSEKAQHQYPLLCESEFEYAERAGSRTRFLVG